MIAREGKNQTVIAENLGCRHVLQFLCAYLLVSITFASNPPDLETTDGWVTWAAPYLWGLSLDGKAQVGEEKGDIDVGFDDILSDLNIGAMAYLDGRKGRFGYFLNPIYSQLTASEKIEGLKVDITNATAIIAVGGYYRWIERRVLGRGGDRADRIAFEPYAGVRWSYMRVEIDADSEGQVDGSEDWLDPLIGGRVLYAWDAHWDIALSADVRGFGVGSDSTSNAHVLIGYRQTLFGRDAIFRLGYRALYQDYDKGSGNAAFQWDVTQEGPIAGIVLRL
ncbi:MAG: hypothetical protein HRT77_11500 [Halioglobus sp.]|nr:hypothetical protein [Halioglobus sp.]